MPLPQGAVGDPSNAFQGVVYGVRYWRSALSDEDLARAAAGGPEDTAALTQSSSDVVCDLELQDGGGVLVRDRSGAAAAALEGRATWLQV